MNVVLFKNSTPDSIVTAPLFLHSLELLVTAIYYNPSQTLALLTLHNWTHQFFTQWFKNLERFTRVHDRKLCLGAICALLEWFGSGGSPELRESVGLLVGAALTVFRTLPMAIKSECICSFHSYYV